MKYPLRLLCALFMILLLSFPGEVFTPASENTDIPSARLPDAAVFIGEEAFMGTKLLSVALPDGMGVVEKRAFAGIDGLTVKIPDSVYYIGSDAFEGSENLTVIASRGSYARRWAVANRVAFVPSDAVLRVSAEAQREDMHTGSAACAVSLSEDKAARSGVNLPAGVLSMRPQERAELHPINEYFP